MTATKKLLERWMTAKNVSSQSAAARRLGITPGGVNNWVAGRSQAAPYLIELMAKEVGDDPTGWLALVESERARDATDRKTWAAVARRFGIAAAVALCAIGASNYMIPQENVAAVCTLCSLAVLLLALVRRPSTNARPVAV